MEKSISKIAFIASDGNNAEVTFSDPLAMHKYFAAYSKKRFTNLAFYDWCMAQKEFLNSCIRNLESAAKVAQEGIIKSMSLEELEGLIREMGEASDLAKPA